MTPVIDVDRLSRVYDSTKGFFRRTRRSVRALDAVSFQVKKAEVFGLVGPNGAGKTTLVKILTTLLLPTSGSAQVLGLDVSRRERQVRRHINFVLGGEQGLYGRLSCQDNLQFFSDLHRVPRSIARQRIPELLKLVGLWERRGDRVEQFSKGMKQRLHIAKALVNSPEVLFLDEPTIGLDPGAARQLREIIGELRMRGVTIVLTSHYMEEMEVLCDRIAVINHGRIITLGTPAELKSRVGGASVVELQTLHDLSDAIARLRESVDTRGVSISAIGQANMLRVLTDDATATVAGLRAAMPQANFERLVQRPPSLEDAYMAFIETGRSA